MRIKVILPINLSTTGGGFIHASLAQTNLHEIDNFHQKEFNRSLVTNTKRIKFSVSISDNDRRTNSKLLNLCDFPSSILP